LPVCRRRTGLTCWSLAEDIRPDRVRETRSSRRVRDDMKYAGRHQAEGHAAMKIRLALLAIVGSLAAGTPLAAHHSFSAEFDAKQAVRITGALTGIEWPNPHSYFHLAVKNDKETVEGG